MELPIHSPWYRQLAARICLLAPLKAVGTMSFMALFFWAYFAVLRHPSVPPSVMPLTALDEWIAFTPAAFPIYAALWVYVSLPPALIAGLRPLLQFGAWIAGLCLFCLGIFWLWPTTVPVSPIDWAQYPEMAMIKGLDAAGNACPSLHVASAVFSAVWLDRLLRRVDAPALPRGLSIAFCLAILWSTVATRQHVVLDVVAGALVGLAFAVPALRQVTAAAGKAGI
jgi:hypothetical protein